MYFATAPGVYEWGGLGRGFAFVFLIIFQVCLENMGTTLEEFPPYLLWIYHKLVNSIDLRLFEQIARNLIISKDAVTKLGIQRPFFC